jgi:hypothetical protein
MTDKKEKKKKDKKEKKKKDGKDLASSARTASTGEYGGSTMESAGTSRKRDSMASDMETAMSASQGGSSMRSSRRGSTSSVSSDGSLMSYPDTEPDIIAIPQMPKRRIPVVLPEAKDWIKVKLNKKKLTNKEGRQEVYDSIVDVMDEIYVVTGDIYEELCKNKDDPVHLPVIKNFAEARGLYKRRIEKTKEHLGNNKEYLDHIRLHRQCLVDGVMFDSQRKYDDDSFGADMNTIRQMKRGIMKLMGKDPDQWEYDPEEFEELRKVRGNLSKIWGGHLLKKEKQLRKMQGTYKEDMDERDRTFAMEGAIKQGVAASKMKASVGAVSQYEKAHPVQVRDRHKLAGGLVEKKDGEQANQAAVVQQDTLEQARQKAAAAEQQKGESPNLRRRKSQEIQQGEQWAQQAAQGAKAPASPAGDAAPMEVANYSVETEEEGEIDIAQEIIDAMDSFISDKFYKLDVKIVQDGKGKKFAGNLDANGKPDGRGVLILPDKSQHI